MMINNSSTSCHQYAVISYVAQKVGGGFRLGKTAMQKLVYLMQELGGVPLQYRFHFYHYGPYSSDLAGDLEFVNTLKGISIDYNPSLNIYGITQGEKTDALISKAYNFIKDYKEGIDSILEDFGRRRVQELGLIATITYVWKDAQQEEWHDKEYIINKVAELKPKFTTSEIQASLHYLKTKGYLD